MHVLYMVVFVWACISIISEDLLKKILFSFANDQDTMNVFGFVARIARALVQTSEKQGTGF